MLFHSIFVENEFYSLHFTLIFSKYYATNESSKLANKSWHFIYILNDVMTYAMYDNNGCKI